MARSKGTNLHYRDTKTGRFVSKSTWKRSKAQGGTRYKREKQQAPKHPEGEYQINVKYKPNTASKVEIQIAAEGPAGKTREQVIRAVEYRIRNGESPEGWEIHLAEWRKGKKKYSGDDTEEAWRGVSFLFPLSGKDFK